MTAASTHIGSLSQKQSQDFVLSLSRGHSKRRQACFTVAELFDRRFLVDEKSCGGRATVPSGEMQRRPSLVTFALAFDSCYCAVCQQNLDSARIVVENSEVQRCPAVALLCFREERFGA